MNVFATKIPLHLCIASLQGANDHTYQQTRGYISLARLREEKYAFLGSIYEHDKIHIVI